MTGPCVFVCLCLSSTASGSTGGPWVVAAFFHAGLLRFILFVHMRRKDASSQSEELETGPPRLVSYSVSTSTFVWIEGTFQ